MGDIPQRVFWVGSVREWSAVDVVDFLYGQFGDKLLTLPHGEWSRLESWAMDTLRRTQDEVEDHVVTVPGDSATYNSLRRVSYVGDGTPNIRPEFLSVVAESGELREAVRSLRRKVGRGEVLPPAHLGSIDPAAWAEYTYESHEQAVQLLPAYRSAFVKAMNQACRGSNIAAQIESPYALVSVLTAPKHQRCAVARARAQEIADTVNQLQTPVRIHLCYGDFGGRSWLDTIDLEALVILVNAIHAECPRVLSYLLPMAAGNIQPSLDRRFYAPLRDIRPDVRAVVGVLRPEVNDATNFAALMLACETLPCRVEAFSLPCGAGRLSDDAFYATVCTMQECLRRAG